MTDHELQAYDEYARFTQLQRSAGEHFKVTTERRFINPFSYAFAYNFTHRNGRYIIALDPAMQEAERSRVLLHTTGHIILGHLLQPDAIIHEPNPTATHVPQEYIPKVATQELHNQTDALVSAMLSGDRESVQKVWDSAVDFHNNSTYARLNLYRTLIFTEELQNPLFDPLRDEATKIP